MSGLAVLLSGGVDSSVALRLAQQAGRWPLTAFYLKVWLEDELAHLGECPWEEDLKWARAVCAQAGVPLEVVPLQAEYHQRVVEAALAELRAGRTPSPDIWCNSRIKFGVFLEHLGAGFEKIVSGHYAQVERRDEGWVLRRSPDPVKDQTYFLSALTQAQLQRLWFPVGPLTKAKVRRLAAGWGLPNAARPDSQGICFLGRIKYSEFVRCHLGEREGEIIEFETGKRLGTHRGFWFYTVGQRDGLGLSGGPWYVVRKDPGENRVWVSHGDRARRQARSEFQVNPVNWITGPPGCLDVQTKVRHGPRLVDSRLEALGGACWRVTLSEPDPGIAPGQTAVFYAGDVCLGGGPIQ